MQLNFKACQDFKNISRLSPTLLQTYLHLSVKVLAALFQGLATNDLFSVDI